MPGKMAKNTRPDLVEKRFRMMLDFRVLIGEVREEDIRRDNGDDWEHAREHAERQNRLLRALLQDKEALRQFMTYLVTDRVCGHTDSELGRVFKVRREEEMLEPAYTKMSEDDVRFFREVSEEGIFWENTEQFEWCFAVDWTEANLIEIKAEIERDTSAGRGYSDLDRLTK